MHVDAVLSDPKPFEETRFEIVFEGPLPIPYEANTITLPKDAHEISVDLLQLYCYSLNPRVARLALRFPRAGSYTISDIRLVN
jgi:hypothetical protein